MKQETEKISATLAAVIIAMGAIQVVSAWFAVNGSVPGRSAIYVLAVITLIVSPVALLSCIVPQKPAAKWREWFSHSTDIATISILIAHGWTWTAIAFVIGFLVMCCVFSVRRELAKQS